MFNPTETNFIGRDPMQWWIGQVTDPEKGEWGNSLEKQEAEDGEDIYSHRCRVRIVGYHGNDAELPDKDLPLAHILLPPNMSTVGGRGSTTRYVGGEVVVGFFLDGADGQQPIIFGTLFKQSFVEDKLTAARFNAFKQTEFTPYTPPNDRDLSGGHQLHKKSPLKNSFSPGEKNKTLSQNKKENGTNQSVTNYTACEDNEISKISQALKDFTRQLNEFQKLNSTDVFVNPVYGGIVDIKSEIQLTTNQIHNSMTKLVRRGRSWVIQETLDKMSKTLSDKVSKPNQAPTAQAMSALTNTIFCNFEKIQDGLLDYLSQSLENMLGQVLDVPICGIENFMSDMFGQINNILDTSLGSMFDQLNAIQGGGIALPSATFTKAIKFANIITNVLDCDRQNCPEDNTVHSPKNGISKVIEDKFDNISDLMGLRSLTNPLLDAIDGAIPASPTRPDCSTNVLKCGPPRVDFIGGNVGTHGATGNAIVNVLGRVIGVSITEPGFGYVGPPLVSFVDSCENGYGAGGFPIMGDVIDPDGNPSTGVIAVVMTSSGQEYLPNTTETDIDGNVKEIIPDPNANYDGEVSYVTSLDSIVVENTGFDYDSNDTASVIGGTVGGAGIDTDDVTKPGQAQIELITEDGFITGANVVNGGFGFTSLPRIRINSDTGAGAKLRPVLKFTRVDDASQLAQVTQDAVVTVISCIEK